MAPSKNPNIQEKLSRALPCATEAAAESRCRVVAPVVLCAVLALGLGCSGAETDGGAPGGEQQPRVMTGMIEVHNRVRASVGVPPLTWSPTLASYAQAWAEHLASDGCRMVHRSHAGNNPLKAGENLYWASPTRWSDGRSEPQRIAPEQPPAAWAGEGSDYDLGSNRCAEGKVCGHYTQMVWASSRQVGCGSQLCADGGQIWVCNYDPPGNWVGQRPY